MKKMRPVYINEPLSKFTAQVLKTYLKFPEYDSYSAMDWNAGDGEFLHTLTNGKGQPLLYGLSESVYDVGNMRSVYGFQKAFMTNYRAPAKITNDVFSLMIVNPYIDERLEYEIFDKIDPFTMPNFEEEVRNQVLREEEERERLRKQMEEQIDFGELNLDNTERKDEETKQERQARIEEKIKEELKKRIKAWRMALKEQQKRLSGLRWDNFLLQRATNYLRPGGILIMITPKELIDDSIAFKLVNQYENIRILRLDDDEYRDYRKCIIIAKKRQKPTREHYQLGKAIARTKEKPYKTFGVIRDVTVSKEEDPDLYEKQVFRKQVDSLYGVLEVQAEPLYEVPVCDLEEITMIRVGPVTGDEALDTLKKSKLIQMYQDKYSQVFMNKEPVAPTPLHKGHIMLLLTSGFLNGYIGTGPDQHLVKGSAIKDVREFEEVEEDGTTKFVEREYYNIGVKLLDADGNFKKIM